MTEEDEEEIVEAFKRKPSVHLATQLIEQHELWRSESGEELDKIMGLGD